MAWSFGLLSNLAAVAGCCVISPALHLRLVHQCLAFAAFALTATASAKSPALERSVSRSRQFIIYAPDVRVRGGICDLAEQTKTNMLTLLEQRDEWRTPILVHAQLRAADSPDRPAARLNFSQTGFGLKLQLELVIASDVSPAAIQRELLSALLLEWMYRGAPDTPAGTAYVQPPAWLVDGLLALSANENNAAAGDAVASAVADNKLMPVEELLREQAQLLEPSSQAVYRVYAGALVSMLIGLPDGRARLTAFITALPQAGNDPTAPLQERFPEIGGDPKVSQQRWKDAVAQVASRNRFRMQSCAETDRELATLVTVQLRSGKAAEVYSLEQYAEFIKAPGAADALRRVSQQLLLLSGRANPLYAPIIAEYQQITSRLAHRKTGKITERLARVRAAREEISRRMTAIDDYLNWFEATQSHATSGAFADYMKAAELSAEREPRRRDAISVYLDTVEAQLSP